VLWCIPSASAGASGSPLGIFAEVAGTIVNRLTLNVETLEDSCRAIAGEIKLTWVNGTKAYDIPVQDAEKGATCLGEMVPDTPSIAVFNAQRRVNSPPTKLYFS